MISEPHLVVAKEEDTMQDVVNSMIKANVSAVIVVRSNGEGELYPVGIVTKTDLLQAVFRDNHDRDAPVFKIMTNGVVPISPEAPRDEAAEVIMRHKVHHLVVVNGEKNRLVGIVSAWDIAREVALDNKAWPYVRHRK